MALTQERLAEELGVRQQTVSEWETGVYRPRGASERLLTIVAERAGFEYDAGAGQAAENSSGRGGRAISGDGDGFEDDAGAGHATENSAGRTARTIAADDGSEGQAAR